MYAVFRHTCSHDYDLCDEGHLEYMTSKHEAEDIARELTEIYKVDDGHPWSGCRFFAEEVSQEYLNARRSHWANIQTAAMML